MYQATTATLISVKIILPQVMLHPTLAYCPLIQAFSFL